MTEALFQSNLHSLPLVARGKVRDIYAVGSDRLLMIASDRLSAFDVVMDQPIPGKGRLLTEMALFLFGRLAPVVPNPVRGGTRVAFALPRESNIRLSVHDVQGRERLLLAEGAFAPGRHSLDWTAGGSQTLDPGLYFVRLQVSGRTLTQRFTVGR